MRRKSLEKANCPIARSLERVGEWWSILILRDALHGYTRFEEFRESLGVAPNILTTRLARLIDDGFLEKRQCAEDVDIDKVPLAMRGGMRLVQGCRVYDAAQALHAALDEIPIADRADVIGE